MSLIGTILLPSFITYVACSLGFFYLANEGACDSWVQVRFTARWSLAVGGICILAAVGQLLDAL